MKAKKQNGGHRQTRTGDREIEEEAIRMEEDDNDGVPLKSSRLSDQGLIPTRPEAGGGGGGKKTL